MNDRFLVLMGLCCLSAAVIVGCGAPPTSAKPAGAPDKNGAVTAAVAPLAKTYFLDAEPASAKSVLAAKKDVKEGDEIVLKGRVGGRKDDTFTHGRAMMYIVDTTLEPCNDGSGEGCKTPWDFCCDEPETIADNIALIQFNGPDGKVLKADLKGAAGLDHLSTVVVKGTVGKRADPKSLIVNATSLFVEKPAPKKSK